MGGELGTRLLDGCVSKVGTIVPSLPPSGRGAGNEAAGWGGVFHTDDASWHSGIPRDSHAGTVSQCTLSLLRVPLA